MFANTLAHVGDCGLTWLHVFPYSERPGTPAARMPQVDKAVRKERARALREAGEAAVTGFLAGRVGRREHVLAESARIGRTAQYAPVRLAVPATTGAIFETTIAGADATTLLAGAA
jgi:threonylcarbamoyladenosine tRNA methylthiotransferase MtaB